MSQSLGVLAFWLLVEFDKWGRDFIKGLKSGGKVRLALGKWSMVGCIPFTRGPGSFQVYLFVFQFFVGDGDSSCSVHAKV